MITYDTRRFTSVRSVSEVASKNFQSSITFNRCGKVRRYLRYSHWITYWPARLLYVVKSDAENHNSLRAKEKLRLLGISDSQINQLVSSGQESYSYSFSVYSRWRYVVEEDALTALTPSSQSDKFVSMDGGMNCGISAKQNKLNPLSISDCRTLEGRYVNAGQSILKLWIRLRWADSMFISETLRLLKSW